MKLRDAEERRLLREDGSELCYQSVGRGAPVLLVNGLAGSREVWRELVNHLSDRYRFLLWSYRGLSLPPTAASVGMPEHVTDALAILDARQIEGQVGGRDSFELRLSRRSCGLVVGG